MNLQVLTYAHPCFFQNKKLAKCDYLTQWMSSQSKTCLSQITAVCNLNVKMSTFGAESGAEGKHILNLYNVTCGDACKSLKLSDFTSFL